MKCHACSVVFMLAAAATIRVSESTEEKECKCACESVYPICWSVDTDKCYYHCFDICENNPIHTVNDEGECPDEKNCTCITFLDLYKPVCTKRKLDNKYRTFTNMRNYICQNICTNNAYTLLRENKCTLKEMSIEYSDESEVKPMTAGTVDMAAY